MTRTANETIHSYVTDMIAVETHLENAIKGQIEDLESSQPVVVAALREMHGITQRHLTALRTLEESHDADLGQDLAEFLKRAATTLAGMGAAAVDMLRMEKVPKNLRDDYTAYSLATISYAMLYTTARALDEERVAKLAEAHLIDYTGVVKTLTDLIPPTVVGLLRSEGLKVEENVLAEIDRTIKQAWKR